MIWDIFRRNYTFNCNGWKLAEEALEKGCLFLSSSEYSTNATCISEREEGWAKEHLWRPIPTGTPMVQKRTKARELESSEWILKTELTLNLDKYTTFSSLNS